MSIITVEDLTVGYEGQAVAQGISFALEEGDLLCIVGENGAGKSTLMKTLLHLQEPLQGRIRLGEGVRQGGIGYLPQQTEIQRDFPASVNEVVLSGCQAGCGWRPFYSSEQKKRVAHNLKRMGIEDLAARPYRELSGGQQQRVLLARALCAADRILILDEPVSGLDPKATREMYGLIKQLNEEGMTILMVSHDVREAIHLASHVLHLGRDSFFGSAESYRNSSQGSAFIREKAGEIK